MSTMTGHPMQVEFNSLPPELQRSAPRDVRLSSGGVAVIVLVVAFFFGAITFTVTAILSSQRASRLRGEMDRGGRVTDATVLSVTPRGGKNEKKILGYQFVVDGRQYFDRAEVESRRVRSIAPGAILPVRYLDSDPSVNWISGFEPSGAPIFLIPVVDLGLLIGAGAMIFHLRKQYRLLAEGRAALARVISVSRGRSGKRSVHRVEYEFQLLSGATMQGKCDLTKDPPAEGSTITILYDRDEPTVQIRYPLDLVKLEKYSG